MRARWITGILIAGALAPGAREVLAHNCGSGGGGHCHQRIAMAARPSNDAPRCGAHGAKAADAGVCDVGNDNPDAPHGTPAQKEVAMKTQRSCPMMGGAIDKTQSVDHDGRRIYVCCPPCLEGVKADPEAAIAKLAEKGEAPGQANCVIMEGMKINPEQYVDHDGKRIFVCCAGCIGRVKADPEAAIEKLRERGVAPAKADDGNKPKADAQPETHEQHHHH